MRVLWSVLAAVLLLVGSLLPAAPAWAAVFTVTTTQDAAQTVFGQCTTAVGCTLRAALKAAQDLGGTHVVVLQTAGTYALTLGALTVDNVNVSVVNTSGGTVAVDGGQGARVLTIGATTAAQVSLFDLTIQNGNASSGGGGGVRVGTGSTLILSGMVFSNNTAASTGGGGAIGNLGTLIVDTSTF